METIMNSAAAPVAPYMSEARGERPARRIALACESCRYRKVKCNGESPCTACIDNGDKCTYRTRKYPQRRAAPKNLPLSRNGPSIRSRPEGPGSDPSSRLFNDPANFKKHLELRAGVGISDSKSGAFQFYGPSSHFCFVQRIYQRIKQRNNESLLYPHRSSVPEGLGKWGFERFIFMQDQKKGELRPEVILSPEMGDRLIHAYFKIVHPQMPVLSYAEILDVWNSFFQPPIPGEGIKNHGVVLMVLAIGARVMSSDGEQDTGLSENWANYLYNKAEERKSFEEPSLRSTHLHLLKAFYGFLVMRPNDAYLALGQASRSAIALGIDKLQVVDGSSFAMHRLKITFWTLYSIERTSALFTGRQSSFRDDMIDSPYPMDWPFANPESEEFGEYFQPVANCAWVRAIARIGSIADRILIDIYSSKKAQSISGVSQMVQVTSECEMELESIVRSLPSYLHFFDDSTPIGAGWQEVQRINLGLYYFHTRMLMYRPSLIFVALFDSRQEALKKADDSLRLFDSIEATILSAKKIIWLAHDVYFRRYADLRFDGSLATFLIAACVTLLYEVLDPDTKSDYAKETFAVVELGIKCLSEIQHIGPTTGKRLSLDLLKIASDAFMSTRNEDGPGQTLNTQFPQLSRPFQHQPSVSLMGSTDSGETSNAYSFPSVPPNPELDPLSDISMTSISHWLDVGFNASEIPSSLF